MGEFAPPPGGEKRGTLLMALVGLVLLFLLFMFDMRGTCSVDAIVDDDVSSLFALMGRLLLPKANIDLLVDPLLGDPSLLVMSPT